MGRYSAARDLDLSNKTRWYITACRTEAVFYKRGMNGKLEFIKRITNPQGALKESELNSDRPGRSQGNPATGVIGHALDQRHHHHFFNAVKFAEDIGVELAKAKFADLYGEIVLIAEPRFLGILRQALPTSVFETIRDEVPHEYKNLPEEELSSKIAYHLVNY